MRIGYVGLSTPLFYDYPRPAARTNADLVSSPNPILDSAGALMLLYDELWFLTRSLCPQNLRSASFVRFVDEMSILDDLSDVVSLSEHICNDPTIRRNHEKVSALFRQYDKVREDVGIDWGAGQDNHTHELEIRGMRVSASSMNLRPFACDLVVHARLPVGVELIANRFGQLWLDTGVELHREVQFAQALTIERIPSVLGPDGPYDEAIEEARSHRDLVEFRRWVPETLSKANAREIAEVASAVEETMRTVQRELFLATHSRKSQVLSVGKSVAGMAIDSLLPGAASLAEMIGQWRTVRSSNQLSWMGFLLSLEQQSTVRSAG